VPIKRIKERTDLLDEFKLYSSRKPHYVSVYVWRTLEALHANVDLSDVDDGAGADDGITVACHLPNIYRWDLDEDKPAPDPKLGELHFSLSHWHEELVSHELLHAIIHRMRVLPPYGREMFDKGDINEEEEVCYDFGRWFARLWVRLHELWEAQKQPQ
jgi:hypothetical protein